MKHVISTLSADTNYADWVTQPGVSTIRKMVLVRGGAGIALLGGGQSVQTPFGVRTEVSDEDAAFLENHKMFKEHQARGHVRIENIARDPDKVAQKMDADTGSAPKTPADVANDAKVLAAKSGGLKPEEALQAVTNSKGK